MPSLICWIAIYPLVSIICNIQLGPGCFLCTRGKNYCFVLRINFIVSKQDYEVKKNINSHTGDEILYLGMKLKCTIYKCKKKKVLLLTYKQIQKKFEWKGLPVLII